jgi:N-acetylmuramoyl-L-alanine amidase
MSASQPTPSDSNPPGTFHFLQIVFLVAAVVATLFTAWTPEPTAAVIFLPEDGGIAGIIPPTALPSNWPTPTPRPQPLVGLVVGHWGDNKDPGAVCADGHYTELMANQNIANLVQAGLTSRGLDVVLLQEFDSRLYGFQGSALVSIHADSCVYINELATGFKVATALSNPYPELSARLTACLRNRYAASTNLPVHSTSITPDMTSYHAFSEIDPNTPAAIIETGFLNKDRHLLENEPEKAAEGIINGIVCFLYNEDVSPQVDTGAP